MLISHNCRLWYYCRTLALCPHLDIAEILDHRLYLISLRNWVAILKVQLAVVPWTYTVGRCGIAARDYVITCPLCRYRFQGCLLTAFQIAACAALT